ncbi:hypothetical protein A3J19_03695 [Candidatus Daviesbacteria bacterium RIFCSPLOWO2_02_FULL_41_8]|uniref:Uncharacterized protein n=3 Tax=Candidatus Daviesiibacteriota TaxID=1752718 RepID=A0A1F5NKC0_9BACT|nr:MAG: hypothetical protein A2871_00575 [Candidatus Daviesbacteria bacterium RIFCSPHIGHO2_01_FULL_41_23]OGE32890.1 MAG: hypothetical protein A3D83_01875 [Candidatus Daviesbacteria bacterium RIFCSPHIGHO2_02_FULL_41_10]OGE62391.1 MAG: hypothetical protein A2967_01065 [Candidatus Daviesbacteria bacterium RIFCSPLOWO2_01_FULL_41_32]OGE77993.1 MAG: hypothetical protein A3J19_03695 [Candidatus Daviesbacteria bacterium RIFCSPLOWO2_02_FULL_41_8]
MQGKTRVLPLSAHFLVDQKPLALKIMKEILLQALIVAYAGVGIVGFIGYWPTIKDLYYFRKPSANISSYTLWTIASGIAFLYSLFILPDLLFRIVSGLNFGACALVLFLSIRIKKS